MVIDAFLFTDEVDLLEIRLNELDSVVDKFVIIESLEAHGSTARREACLSKHWSRFKLFEKKIHYIILPQLAPPYTDKLSGWQRENFHRDSLMKPVLEVAESSNDLVIVSDCDEIPRASIVRKCVEAQPSDYPFMFLLDQYYYTVNWFDPKPWDRSSMGTIQQYQNVGGFQAARGKLDLVSEIPYIGVKCAGWHFSSFCSVPRLREKLQNFAHSSDDSARRILRQSDETIATKVAVGINLFTGVQLKRRPSDDSRLPKHLLRYPERFAHLL